MLLGTLTPMVPELYSKVKILTLMYQQYLKEGVPDDWVKFSSGDMDSVFQSVG